MTTAEERIWSRLPAGTREALAGLPGSDLKVLLMSLTRDRSARVRPPDVLRRWREDRLVAAGVGNPRDVAAVEAHLWDLLPDDVEAVHLSPVVPLGTATAVAPQSPNRIVTTTHGVEVLSDPTNALAVEAADRRSRQPVTGEVHLAATAEVMRAQHFGAGMRAHFRLFSLVSSARDTGSGRTEERLMRRHAAFWQKVLADDGEVTVTFYDNPVVRERLGGLVREDGARGQQRGYYTGAAIRLGTPEAELGDGGFTTWTAQLLGDAKERCLVSCISTERLAAVRAGAGDPDERAPGSGG